MRWYLLVLGSLGVWRLTHLLNVEDGPWAILARLRGAGGQGIRRELLGCFHCLSLWVALPFAVALGSGWGEKVLTWPALSAAAILLERLTGAAEPAIYTEDEQPPGE